MVVSWHGASRGLTEPSRGSRKVPHTAPPVSVCTGQGVFQAAPVNGVGSPSEWRCGNGEHVHLQLALHSFKEPPIPRHWKAPLYVPVKPHIFDLKWLC